ncbi:unnamed protein product [Peniophora sp. CBMAI 1063]|nr:unnamed protein product [Peniophora sp. CBMAI 1063]
MTPVFLERARQAPLGIGMDWRHYRFRHDIDDAVALALQHLSHSWSVRIFNPPAGFIEQMITVFGQQDASSLEELHMLKLPDEEVSSPGGLVSAIQLPDQPFASLTPRLRILSLQGYIRFHWCNQLFTSPLTHLRLLLPGNTSFPTMDELLGIIRRCPLEQLVLVQCLPQRPTQIGLTTLPDDYTLADVPTLRYILLRDAAADIADFLRRIRIPADCHIEVGNEHVWHAVNVADIATTVEAVAIEVGCVMSTRSNESKGHALIITHTRDDICRWFRSNLRPSSGIVHHFTMEHMEPRPFVMSLALRPPGTNPDEQRRDVLALARAFDRITPLYHLESIHVLAISSGGADLVSLATWLDLFDGLRRVEIIKAHGIPCHTFGLALGRSFRDPLVMPHLWKLEVGYIHLGYPKGPGQLSKALEEAFHWRNEVHDLKLSVEFDNCHISAAQLRRIQKASDDRVIVSGNSQTCSHLSDEEDEEDEEDVQAEDGIGEDNLVQSS